MKNITPKQKQYLYAGLLGSAGLGFMGFLIWSLGDSVPEKVSSSLETHIETAGSRVTPQELWVERLEGENKITQQKIDALEKLMIANAKSIGDAEEKAARLEKEVADLQTGVTPPSISEERNSETSETQAFESPHAAFAAPPSSEKIGSGIKKIVLQLSSAGAQNSKLRSTLESTLPAGTFARGILLGGVDASTATNAPSDPRPALVRITDKGTLPRKFKSDLKDCHILASCYGDLSSERVYMRLEKLTCTERLTGEISETQVAGYVVGEDGKAGVRGIVVDRTGPVVRNSLLGGFFSGVGKFFESQQSGFALPVMPLGTQNPSSLQQMLVKGGTSGASSALEKYADFFIKRAEQLQPILQVAAGREIDIVFTQGTKFGETSVRKTLTKIRDQSRRQAVETLSIDDKNWLPEPSPGDEP